MEKHIHKQLEIGDKDAVVLFEVPKGRRTEFLAQNQIEDLFQQQEQLGRVAFAQQLSQADDPRVLLAMERARRRAAGGRGGFNPLFPRGAVGFRPVIQVFNEGTNLTVSTAITSADRRYVRITIPNNPPIFSGVGDVATFNFVTGDQGGMGGGGGGMVGGGPGAFGN